MSVARRIFTNDASGVLTIATTHTQARYSLPPVIKAFREIFLTFAGAYSGHAAGN